MSYSYLSSGFGQYSDEPSESLDDILQTVNSLSKISRNEQSPRARRINGYHLPNNSTLYNSYSPQEYYPYQSFSSSDSVNMGRGRGRYMDKLAQKYAKKENSVARDKMIHEQLQQINGSGYSNFDIEQRFGTPTAYSDDWFSLTETSTSSLTNTGEKSTSESEINVNDSSGPSSLPTNFISSSKLTIDNENCADTECQKQQSLEVSQFDDADLLEPIKNGVEEVSKKSPKKKRERKCRNFVILALTQKHGTLQEVSSPNSMPEQKSTEEKKSWILENKDSIFSPEDFPSLL